MANSTTMTPIPEFDKTDVVFGNIKHLPRWEDIPKEFKNMYDPFVRFVSNWFFRGLTQENLDRLKPKEGVSKTKALCAIKAILSSFEPKHEHKEAGAAYLLSQWFDLGEKP